MRKILILEDNSLLRSALAAKFMSNYKVTAVSTLAEAYSNLEKSVYSIAILDRLLPDGDSVELVEYLADASPSTRIIMLTDKHELQDRLEGLSSGCEAYLGKPFDLRELSLIVKRLDSLTKMQSSTQYSAGGVTLFRDSGQVSLQGITKQLRRRESQILECLLNHKNTVVSRDTIVKQVWGTLEIIPTRTSLDVYIRRIRMLLGKSGSLIETVRGYGYVIRDGEGIDK